MDHLGEILALLSAVSCTATALYASEASERLGTMAVNVIRLALAALFLSIVLLVTTGSPVPMYADMKTWIFLLLSALIGYVFGDYCLFNSYLIIGPKIGQLFMTLSPPVAAITGWIILGETMTWKSVAAMAVTIAGIAISILSKDEGRQVRFSIPIKGILLGTGAGVGQGIGLVLSKVGMQYYETAIPADAPEIMSAMMPFASTLIRGTAGCIGFLIIMLLQKDMKTLSKGLKDKTGMKYALMTTLTGPVLGVSLALMAVNHTDTGIASTLMALTPVLIILPYSLIYRKKVTPKEITGVLVSMTGVAMFFML